LPIDGAPAAGFEGGPRPPCRAAAAPFLLSFLAILALSCARIEPPPGGPPDNLPPSLISIRPDSLREIPGFDAAVEFAFDEVISEGGQPSMGLGTSDLERLVILSPTSNIPRVRWKRSVLTVEPKEGWQPNRVYRIELLPGVMDLQRNRMDSGAVVTFTTGAPIPVVTLQGRVVDWLTGLMARPGLIEAMLLPDSLRYRILSDSVGSYVFGPLPRGEYLVYGIIDQNRNLRRDFRDNFDSIRVRADSSREIGVLWAFPHDTVGPRLQNVAALDSMTADLTFNQPLDPYQAFDTTQIRVRSLPDSSPVPVLSFRPRAVDDSIQRALREATDTARRADTTRAALDSARRASEERLRQQPGPGRPAEADRAILASRPALFDHLIARVGTPLVPGRQYTIEVVGIRNVNTVAGNSRLPLPIPERPPPTADSTPPVLPDSVRSDSIPPAPPR
jgi:hypothetical protein